MDITTLYSLRNTPRAALDEGIRTIISKLKISFKPSFRRPTFKRAPAEEASNWRELAMLAVHRKVREKDDPDYDEVNAFLNKLTKQTYDKMMVAIMEKLDKRDSMFRLRVTTLLFDRGVTQTFYAALMADAYKDIAGAYPDAIENQFKDDMTWENYGVWHVDHKLPITSFDIQEIGDEEFMKCWSLDNLQPMWGEENIRKSNKILEDN